jgi:hypothetical protein
MPDDQSPPPAPTPAPDPPSGGPKAEPLEALPSKPDPKLVSARPFSEDHRPNRSTSDD